MNNEPQAKLAEVRAMLGEATRLNGGGQHGAALKLAYHACEHIAAAYLLAITGQALPPNDATFERFYETIHEPERHPDRLSEIEDIAGDVYVLREAYEPALLGETTAKDAQQMIERVVALVELVEQIAGNC